MLISISKQNDFHMKIILLTQYYSPEMGAPQSRLFEMLRGLKQLGVEVSVVTAMPNYPEGRIFNGYRGRFVKTEVRDGIDIIRYWLYASNSKRTLPRIFRMLSFSFTSLFSLRFCRKRKADFIIVESPPLTLAISAWLLTLFCGARLVVNVSDLWPLSALELGVISKGRFYSLLHRLEGFIYKRSASILGQSGEIVDYIKQRGNNNVYLFRNGVDFERFRGLPSSNNSDTKRKIIYAGLLGFAQGVLNICHSIDFGSKAVEFHIYGAGSEKDKIVNFIKDNPQCGIVYKGTAGRDEIPAILKQYDGALIPLTKMIYGAVPSKIYEAMAAGLPILFSGEGEGARIIRDNKLGWVSAPGNMQELSDNIDAFVNADLSDICSRGRILAETTFNRPNQVKNLLGYLENLR